MQFLLALLPNLRGFGHALLTSLLRVGAEVLCGGWVEREVRQLPVLGHALKPVRGGKCRWLPACLFQAWPASICLEASFSPLVGYLERLLWGVFTAIQMFETFIGNFHSFPTLWIRKWLRFPELSA